MIIMNEPKTILDRNLVKEIANYVEDGCSDETAALLAGVEPAQLEEWKKLGEGKNSDPIYKVLCFELKVADARFEHHHIGNVSLAGDEGDWKASEKLLRSKYPQRWNKDNDKIINDDNEFTIRILTPDMVEKEE